jgi:hypothetical protein
VPVPGLARAYIIVTTLLVFGMAIHFGIKSAFDPPWVRWIPKDGSSLPMNGSSLSWILHFLALLLVEWFLPLAVLLTAMLPTKFSRACVVAALWLVVPVATYLGGVFILVSSSGMPNM